MTQRVFELPGKVVELEIPNPVPDALVDFDEVNLFTPVKLNVEKLAKSRLDPSVNDFQTPWSCSKPSKK